MDKYTAEHILELEGSYDLAALKVAYRRLAARNHPDAAEARGEDPNAATEKMRDINEAKDCLEGLFVGGIISIACDRYPGGYQTQAAASAPHNPFEGHYGGSDPRRYQEARRQTTAEYYADDPRFRAYTRRRQEAAQARRTGAAESLGRKGYTIKEDPDRPNPRWYAPVYRFVALFPYRLLFLFLTVLLAGFTDPLHMAPTLGPLRFEDFLIGLGLLNILFPVVTAPIRAVLLWLVDRARDMAWALRGSGGKKAS